MTPDGPREDEPTEETVGARDMGQGDAGEARTDAQTKPQRLLLRNLTPPCRARLLCGCVSRPRK